MSPEEIDALRTSLREAEAALADLRARVDNAQHLASMGDYDWGCPSGWAPASSSQ